MDPLLAGTVGANTVRGCGHDLTGADLVVCRAAEGSLVGTAIDVPSKWTVGVVFLCTTNVNSMLA